MKNFNLNHIDIMKQIVFISCLTLFCSVSVKAQDLLVTVKRDTLNCKMEKMQNDHYPITFIVEEDNEIIKALIHKDSVFFFKKNVFRGLHDNRLRPWYPLVEIGFDAGVAYQFGKFRIDDDLTTKSDYGARTGFYLGTDLTYYISKRIGYGLKYNYRSLLGGDIQYQYCGLMMAVRFLERRKSNYLFFNFSAGMGWMAQKNAPIQLLLIRPRIEMHAQSLSGDIAVGYNFKLFQHVSVHVKASCNIGYPNFVKIEDLTDYVMSSFPPLEIDGYCNNMNTINLTAGFSFH